MMARLLTLWLVATIAVSAAAQQVYKSTDEDGTPSFSDVPREDAEKLSVPPANVMPAPKDIDFKLDLTPRTTKVKYNKLEVIEPENDAVVYIRTTNLPIQVNVLPPVRNDLGHKLQITFDGNVLIENQVDYTLDDAHRGTHIIAARVVDENGRTVAESKPVAVHIKKPTILN